MAKRPQTRNKPLLDNPVTKPFPLVGNRSSAVVEITVCPKQWVHYKVVWDKKPPAGITAICEGQVTLHRKNLNRRADSLGKIRAVADGPVYGGQLSAAGIHSQFLHSFQLDDVDDFEFYGKIYEGF